MLATLTHAYRVVYSSVREAITKRSGKWKVIERLHLDQHPNCAACGGSIRIQVHHEKPFHLDPPLELDLKNLITLCMGPFECHLRIGHGDNFKAYNPHVVADSKAVLEMPAKRAEIEVKAKETRLFELEGDKP